jgi:hypothetical protein
MNALRGAAAGRALFQSKGDDGKKLPVVRAGSPTLICAQPIMDAGDSLDKRQGVCSGNVDLVTFFFGLDPYGKIILAYDDQRAQFSTEVWEDTSGITGDHLTLEADGTAVLHDDKGAPLCALGYSSPGLRSPKLVVNNMGAVSVRSAGTQVWTLDETSVCS